MNPIKILFILFSLFTFHFSLFARDALPVLVEGGELFENRKDFYTSSLSSVNSIALSPNEKWIVTGSLDNSIKVWDIKTGILLKILEGHTASISSVIISSNGKVIISASLDKSIKIWNSFTGELIKSIDAHEEAITSIVLSKDGKILVSGSEDSSIMVWNVTTGEIINRIIRDKGDDIKSLVLSSDNKTIFSASYNKGIEIWETFTGKLLKEFKENQNSIGSLAISSDDKIIISASNEGIINVWNIISGKIIKRLDNHMSIPINIMIIDKDKKNIISGLENGDINVWNIQTGKLLKKISTTVDMIQSIVIRKDGKYIILGSNDNYIKIFDVSKKREIKGFTGEVSTTNTLSISQDGSILVCGLDDNSINIWDVNHNKLLKNLKGNLSRIVSLMISSSGNIIVSALSDNSIKIWDTKKGVLLKTLVGHSNVVNSIAISNDDNIIVSGSSDNSIKIWDAKKGILLKTLDGHTSDINSVDISSDNKLIISGSVDSMINIWDIKEGLLKSIIVQGGSVRAIQISKNMKSIVAGLANGDLFLINKKEEWVKEGRYSHSLASISSIVLNDDGSIILTNSGSVFGNNSIQMINIKKNIYKKLKGNKSFVNLNSMVASKNMNKLVFTSGNGSIEIWNIKEEKILKEFQSGKNTQWIIFDYKKKKFFRGDDGKLLYKKNGASLSLIKPNWLPKEDKVILKSNGVSVLNDKHNTLNISVRNTSGNRLYWIKNNYYADKYCYLLEHRISTINPNEDKNLSIDIDVTLPKLNPRPINNHEINLTLETATGSEFNITVPISIRYANITIKKAELSKDKKNLNIELVNIGNEPLKNAKVKLLKPFDADIQDLALLETNATKVLSYALPKNRELDKNATIDLDVFIPNIKLEKEKPKEDVAPSYIWEVRDIPIVLNPLSWFIYVPWILAGFFFLWSIWQYRRYKNSIVQTFTQDPKALLTSPPTLLAQAKEKLDNINQWQTTLKSANINESRANKALEFYNDPQQKMEQFKELIGAKHCQQEGEFFRLTLADEFKLKVNNLLLYFASDDAEESLAKVLSHNEIVWVIVTEESEQKLVDKAKDRTNNLVATTQAKLTTLLLGRESQEVLAEILAENLSFKLLSPYPTESGVAKESSFFGRLEIIRDILSQNNANYFLVGARLLGKTAILQALQRRYANDEKAECFYVTLQADTLVKSLADVLEMINPTEVTLDDLVVAIGLREKKAIFLIDEVDKMIANDTNDEITSFFRKLSQEGKATFVLTGFWTFYYNMTSDHKSPLLNLGKLIILDGLEHEACRELLVEPMKSMGLRYENDEVVEQLIVRCGRRANLLATTCSKIIGALDEEQRIITQEMVETVVKQTGLDEYRLSTWGSIGTVKELNALDRLIVYLTLKEEQFTFEEIVEQLEEIKPDIEIENITKSLKRLVIGYVLSEEESVYKRRIPLLKEKLLSGLETHIKGEIKVLVKSGV